VLGLLLHALILFGVGLFACLLGSLVGLGGGFIMVPALAFVFHGEPTILVGTSLVAIIFNSLASIQGYRKQRRIDYKSGAFFALCGIPASVLGALVSQDVSGRLFYVLFGSLLLAVSVFLLIRPEKPAQLRLRNTVERQFVDASGNSFTYGYNAWFAGSIAAVVGFLSSLLGVGGGSIMVPTMVLLLSFPAHIAGATSMFMILLSTIVGGGTHALLGDVNWLWVLFLAPGALIGGRLGSHIAPRISSRRLIQILAILMCLVAIELMVQM
jgi:uncharacterized membrane protein YfcA